MLPSLRSSLVAVALGLVVAATAVGAPVPSSLTSSRVGFTAYTKLFDAEGSFKGVTVSGTIDPDDLTASRPVVVVDVKTIDTGSGARDKHLRTEDFFFVDKYPTAKFVVAKIEPKEGASYTVTGDLTIRDVTRRVSVPATISRETAKGGERVVRVQATFPVKWKEYGMPWNGAFYAPEIKEVIDVKVDLSFADPSPTQASPPAEGGSN